MGPRVQYFIFYSDLLHDSNIPLLFVSLDSGRGLSLYLYNRAPG